MKLKNITKGEKSLTDEKGNIYIVQSNNTIELNKARYDPRSFIIVTERKSGSVEKKKKLSKGGKK